MLQFLTSTLSLTVIGFYAYVAVAAARMELKAGAGWLNAIAKAATWPLTIWHTIEKLYDV